MWNIVLDTNVIVSAGLKRNSIPHRLIEGWVLNGRVNVITSLPVIHEYLDVLGRSKFASLGFPPEWLDDLIGRSILFPNPHPWPHSLPDVTDEPFLALAHSANAWLITGNLKHFPKSSRNGVKVLLPDEYLAFLLHED